VAPSTPISSHLDEKEKKETTVGFCRGPITCVAFSHCLGLQAILSAQVDVLVLRMQCHSQLREVAGSLWFRYLENTEMRSKLKLSTTLVICYLACNWMREPILLNDFLMYDFITSRCCSYFRSWGKDGRIPYLSLSSILSSVLTEKEIKITFPPWSMVCESPLIVLPFVLIESFDFSSRFPFAVPSDAVQNGANGSACACCRPNRLSCSGF